MRPSLPQLFFTTLVLGILLLNSAPAPPLAGVEEGFVNWLAANSNGAHDRAPVTLIEIDNNCLLNYPWPWSPLNYALFLNAALQFHARAVGIEPVLAWDARILSPPQLLQQPQFEKILHDAILRTPKLELGARLGFPEDPDILPPMQPLQLLRKVSGATDAVPEYTVVEAQPGDIGLTAGLGFCNVPPSEPAVLHAPLVFRYRGNIVPSFVLEALMLWHGITPDEVEVRLGSDLQLGDKLSIPINRAGAMRVDWKQPWDRAGFDDLVLAEDQIQGKHATVIDPATLKDRLLILARTDSDSQTLLLPIGRMAAPGELFAAAVATAETHAFAKQPGPWAAVLVLALALAFAWMLSRHGKLFAVPAVIGFMAAYLLLCLVIFETARVALPFSPMIGVALFLFLFRLLAPGGKKPPGRETGPVTPG